MGKEYLCTKNCPFRINKSLNFNILQVICQDVFSFFISGGQRLYTKNFENDKFKGQFWGSRIWLLFTSHINLHYWDLYLSKYAEY
jgi:hypothetical protein